MEGLILAKKNNSEVLFKGSDGKDVTFEDLLRKIYENAEAKNFHLLETARNVGTKIDSIQDAVMVLPFLTSLQSVSVKNDEQLVKMAAIVARQNKKVNADDDDLAAYGITAEMRKEIMEEAQKVSIRPGQAKGE